VLLFADGGVADNQLKVNLKDLLDADKVGRWWIVGSAWEGHKDQVDAHGTCFVLPCLVGHCALINKYTEA
jgi:nucleolar MIF4G domain-containing protein 1